MIKKIFREFLSYLQMTHPLPPGVALEVKTTRKPTVKYGKYGDAAGTFHKVGPFAVITISLDQKPTFFMGEKILDGRTDLKILTTIAHEYKHALQAFNRDTPLNGDYNGPDEVEAREWATPTVEAFLARSR
ncbi:hypothetical protein DESUT3_13700 [Desulfuromonas versatilis]|uniref:Uncharacterized protein n=1 Tax=Desulfuromonas versatilis TaxID=2802975 RepID=A0ABM8HUA5_9BACT|nr:hypothetical protein [Desulfuromonas versatilis]BCR04301.1 hypothetical protein DESUT3_13700 [Desulfuromonas versatilis]